MAEKAAQLARQEAEKTAKKATDAPKAPETSKTKGKKHNMVGEYLLHPLPKHTDTSQTLWTK